MRCNTTLAGVVGKRGKRTRNAMQYDFGRGSELLNEPYLITSYARE